MEERGIAAFYDALAPNYNEMTSFDARMEKEREICKQLIKQYSIHTMLDAGCGTGIYSLLFAQLGVDVTAIDVSEQMLQQLGSRSQKLHTEIKTYQLSFQDIKQNITERFDAVLCVGNSLPHLLTKEERMLALYNFYTVLKPGGTLIIQQLNYDRVFLRKDRIQNIKEIAGKSFIRFYDFGKETVTFNLLTIERKEGAIEHTLNGITLRPLLQKELLELLQNAGFTGIERYSSLIGEAFDIVSSKDLVVIARK